MVPEEYLVKKRKEAKKLAFHQGGSQHLGEHLLGLWSQVGPGVPMVAPQGTGQSVPQLREHAECASQVLVAPGRW